MNGIFWYLSSVDDYDMDRTYVFYPARRLCVANLSNSNCV